MGKRREEEEEEAEEEKEEEEDDDNDGDDDADKEAEEKEKEKEEEEEEEAGQEENISWQKSEELSKRLSAFVGSSLRTNVRNVSKPFFLHGPCLHCHMRTRICRLSKHMATYSKRY